MRFLALAACALASAATYEVGPAKPLAELSDVPWATLEPGDAVLIHWREQPYKEKFVLCRQGTPDAPITVRGVANPETGALPVIDGNDATTARGLNFWSEARGVIKIGGANIPPDTMPRHIVVENLDVRSARQPFMFTDRFGNRAAYARNASAIYLEKGENIVIRNCTIHDSGNGLFVASSDSGVSRDILVEANYIHGNGNPGSGFEHNSYTAAVGIVFQFNRYGPLRAGAGGNNLKDRSAGLAVRYNWIEGGNRQLDLVDGEDTAFIRDDASYRATHVYANVLIENAGDGNRQIVHYGGDSGNESAYRKGVLHFYNNTIVSWRTDRTTLFRLSTNEERADARNNIFWVSAGGETLSLLDVSGMLDLARNWFKPGWRNSFGDFGGRVRSEAPIEGDSPGFVNAADLDFRLAPDSPAIDAGTTLDAAVLPAHEIWMQYVEHQAGEERPRDPLLDLGAYEASRTKAR